MERDREERGIRGRERETVCCISCRGLLKYESKAYWLSPLKVPLTALLLRACQSLPPPHPTTDIHMHIMVQEDAQHTERHKHTLSN